VPESKLAEEAVGDAVSIVVPARNEESAITAMLTELVACLDDLPQPAWEIVVVDDGSTDGTSGAVTALAEDRIRVIRHPVGRGYGGALKAGIRRARHPWILIIDADGTYPPSHVPELLASRDGQDMVVGARVGSERRIPLVRRPPKWVLRKFASALSGAEILDLNSGFRIFRRDLAERFLPLLPNGFSFTSTLTLAALSSGAGVGYVPIDYRRRTGRSKIRPFRDTLNFLTLIIRTVMFFDPLRVLLPLGLSFLVAAVAVGFGSVMLTGRLMDVTTVVLLVAGVQILALGAIADVINRWLH